MLYVSLFEASKLNKSSNSSFAIDSIVLDFREYKGHRHHPQKEKYNFSRSWRSLSACLLTLSDFVIYYISSYFLIVSILELCFCKRHHHVKGHETSLACLYTIFIKDDRG